MLHQIVTTKNYFMKKIYYIKDDFINARLDRWFRKNICEIPQSLIEKNIRKKKY